MEGTVVGMTLCTNSVLIIAVDMAGAQNFVADWFGGTGGSRGLRLLSV